jgi:hypothetical protein
MTEWADKKNTFNKQIGLFDSKKEEELYTLIEY